jgi:hypothetical protein
MALVIKDIIGESRDYYRNIKRENVGRLLINPRGSLYQKKNGKTQFFICGGLRRKKATHLHRQCEDATFPLYKKALPCAARPFSPIRGAKAAMKELVVESEHKKTKTHFRCCEELFQVMADAGLWGEGIVLIGPWCFKVYQNFCGVGYFPDRTLDVDF